MGEAEALQQQVADLRTEVTTTKAEAALLRAGYSGDKPEQMIKLLDLDDLAGSLEELKEEFPEKFARRVPRHGRTTSRAGPQRQARRHPAKMPPPRNILRNCWVGIAAANPPLVYL